MGRKKKILEEVKEEAEHIAEKIVETVKDEAKILSGEDAEKKKEDKKIAEKSQQSEEFPNLDFGVDVFSSQEQTAGKSKITKQELEKKAKELAEKIKETGDIKERFEEELKTFAKSEEYLKAGVYIGTKVITPNMRAYVYRRRNDGIAILDINQTDKKLKEFAKLLSQYSPENFIIVCKREAGWKAVKKFSEFTGVRVFTKKYPAGILTNSSLPNFFETEMVFVVDPWIDKNAINDAKRIKKKVFALCDTNNYTANVDIFVPCNNKSGKSIGFVFYLIAKEYAKARGINAEIQKEDFMDESLG